MNATELHPLPYQHQSEKNTLWFNTRDFYYLNIDENFHVFYGYLPINLSIKETMLLSKKQIYIVSEKTNTNIGLRLGAMTIGYLAFKHGDKISVNFSLTGNQILYLLSTEPNISYPVAKL